GQFSSLRVGLQEVMNRGRDAAVVALVDRPPCDSATVERLLGAFSEAHVQGKWAVVPEYGGRHGHPIVVGREMIEAFLKAPPTSSAREVEHSLPDRILYLAVEDPLVAVNVDTPEDYERLVTA
ncbi:MAG: nucleotidyltransferase family protein, partial [Terriglobales bacterium]